MTYPQWENGVRLSASLKASAAVEVGDVKIIVHRPFEGAQDGDHPQDSNRQMVRHHLLQ
jgi:hypothetical protein